MLSAGVDLYNNMCYNMSVVNLTKKQKEFHDFYKSWMNFSNFN